MYEKRAFVSPGLIAAGEVPTNLQMPGLEMAVLFFNADNINEGHDRFREKQCRAREIYEERAIKSIG